MELLNHLALGFSVALTPINLLYAFIGSLLGTLIGVLPGYRAGCNDRDAATDNVRAATGIGADHAGWNLLRRAVRRVDDVDSAQHAGRNVIRLSRASTATRWPAKVRRGAALATAAMCSFFAGTVATIFVATVAIPLSEFALKFGPAEYFSLMVLGLIGAVVLAHGRC
jgi:hypothetical protein